MNLLITAARGLDALVADELRALGFAPTPVGSAFACSADLASAYRAVVQLRMASRVLVEIARLPVSDEQTLYDAIRTLRWRDHLGPRETLAVDFTGGEPEFRHSLYAAQRVKDAVCDQLRDELGERPSVDLQRPDVPIHVHVANGEAIVSIDLGAGSLHRRGWRSAKSPAHAAPLKEGLAAALLTYAEWPQRAAEGAPLVDPFCGSGTILLEGACMAVGMAPGLLRARLDPREGFPGHGGHWRGHDLDAFRRALDEAAEALRPTSAQLYGWDQDGAAVALAHEQIARVRNAIGRHAPPISVEKRALAALLPPSERAGVLVTNPPYGERLGDTHDLIPLYQELGDRLKRHFPSWSAVVLCGNQPLAQAIGLRPTRRYPLWNGPIECRALLLPIAAAAATGEGPAWRRASPESESFRNRLQKSARHLAKWAKREGISCYRLYDADLPEYAVAVDLYEDAVHVQEYAPPATVDAPAAERRLRDIMLRVPEALGLPAERVFLKTRRRQRPQAGEQYERMGERGEELEVREGRARLLVNLSDFLDTGLYLDERDLRAFVAAQSVDKELLNLYCYTGSATVQAAIAGARASLSVDLSNTYLAWAERNFELNGLDLRHHRLVREDVITWLEQRSTFFDIAFVAPPTYSNSRSRSAADFDVQRDHVYLIELVMQRLRPGGLCVFSTHFRRFKIDDAALNQLGFTVENVSRKYLPPDFSRDPKIHQIYLVSAN